MTTVYLIVLTISHFIAFSPNLCQTQHATHLKLSNIKISFINHGAYTTFNLTSSLNGDSWMAIGFNDLPAMV
jgi:hypothetical protein